MKRIPGKFLGLPPALLASAGLTGFSDKTPSKNIAHPNILLIMADQIQTPPEGYSAYEGAMQDVKDVIRPGQDYGQI